MKWRVALLLLCASVAVPAYAQQPTVTIASKAFPESELLGEMLVILARETGANVEHKRQLGGTRFVYDALLTGDVDAYVDYTGTLSQEIFGGENLNDQQIRERLAGKGVQMGAPLGFNNNYALALRRKQAEELGISKISDLCDHPDLAFGFSNEFMDRGDGWPALRQEYNLPQTNVRGMAHSLAYQALSNGGIDCMEIFTTDPEVQLYDLQALDDNKGFFPHYDALVLYREDLAKRAPQVVAAFQRLEGRLTNETMIKLNKETTIDKVSPSVVAAAFLSQEFDRDYEVEEETAWQMLVANTIAHLQLVGISLAAAILVAIPLGVVAAKQAWLGQVILSVTGLVQTVPSLALLILLIPLCGIGELPAIVALFLYSLLPIVRNTYTGVHDIPPALRESAEALGLPAGARLWRIELPLASRMILAGIKTSAVINVGTATLGGLIGAGGYGQPIMTGINLHDSDLMFWQGALPAAVLALVVQGLFELLERAVVPAGLRLKPV